MRKCLLVALFVVSGTVNVAAVLYGVAYAVALAVRV
jgi:hypothetical protein